MAERPLAADSKETNEVATPPSPPRRPMGHRNTDVRDTVAEMAARAQEISQEAGSKVAQAMKDVISAAAGLAGFAIESARELVQYMVRRGQMTQEEGDRLLREAEEAHARHRPAAPPAAPRVEAPKRPEPALVADEPAASEAPAPPATKAAAPSAKKSAPPPKVAKATKPVRSSTAAS